MRVASQGVNRASPSISGGMSSVGCVAPAARSWAGGTIRQQAANQRAGSGCGRWGSRRGASACLCVCLLACLHGRSVPVCFPGSGAGRGHGVPRARGPAVSQGRGSPAGSPWPDAGLGVAGGPSRPSACLHEPVGRPTGVAGVGLLQVRAFALIPCGEGLRPPCASLARGRGPLSLHRSDLPAAGEGARRAAVAVRLGVARGRVAVFLGSSPGSATLRARCRGSGCACKGVFITPARYENFPLAPSSSRAPRVAGRRTQEDGTGGGCAADAIRNPFTRGSESRNPAGLFVLCVFVLYFSSSTSWQRKSK